MHAFTHLRGMLLPMVALATLAGAAALHCAEYAPQTCLFSEAVAFSNELCGPTPCAFDAEQEFGVVNGGCPFPESGTYTYAPAGAAGCDDPFVSTHRAGPALCGARCCRADHAGDFVANGTVPGGTGAARAAFQPSDADCRYGDLTRGQVLRYLRTRGADVVVIGDSMMRQLHLRLVAMLRGQARLLDYHIHTHAQYLVCGEADAFRTAHGDPRTDSSTGTLLADFLRGAPGPGVAATRASLARCSRRPVHIPFIWAPRWWSQASGLERYFETAAPGSKPVIVTSVAYWERAATVSPSYLEALVGLRGRVRKVFIVGVPTAREVREERNVVYRGRNAFMKAWAAEQGEPYAFVDYEALAQAKNAPPAGPESNLHYMCAVEWVHCQGCGSEEGAPAPGGSGEAPVVEHVEVPAPEGGVGAAVDMAGPQIRQGEVRRVRMNADGRCGDEMNRNLWQLMFNALVPPAT